MILSREERRREKFKNKRMEEIDYSLCCAECNKKHCARNKANRDVFSVATDLYIESIKGHCDNYISKGSLSIDKKRRFRITK